MRKKSGSAGFLTGASIGLFCLLSLGVSANTVLGEEAAKGAEQSSTLGELKIEGKYIQQLVLVSKDGRKESLKQPAESVTLPAGEYQLVKVRLDGGYTCNARGGYGDWVTVNEDKSAVLKVGAPLRQIVKTKRQGRVLILSYQLLGAGGESYTSDTRKKAPQFAIYKGDKTIASGSFEYG